MKDQTLREEIIYKWLHHHDVKIHSDKVQKLVSELEINIASEVQKGKIELTKEILSVEDYHGNLMQNAYAVAAKVMLIRAEQLSSETEGEKG